MGERQVWIIAAALGVLGIFLFLYKALALGFPVLPHETISVWKFEVHLSFNAKGGPIKASLFLPRETNPFRIMNEHLIAGGYGMSIQKDFQNRKAVWAIRKARGTQHIYYRAIVRSDDRPKNIKQTELPPLKVPKFNAPALLAARNILSRARRKSADPDTFVSEVIRIINAPYHEHNVRLLIGKDGSILNRLKTATEVLALEGIHARVTNGIKLRGTRRNAKLRYWLEAYHDEAWHPHDPVRGVPGVPRDYLAWWRGTNEPLKVEGASGATIRISHTPISEPTIENVIARGKGHFPAVVNYSLFSLPVETQSIYRVLLMIPLGAFLMAFLRNVIGIKTIGTFMPVLIALSFRGTELVGGIILFSLLAGLGLAVRLYMERLKLLHIPRLASVLTVVVISMMAVSIISHHLNIAVGVSIALFPMVILAMTIERLCMLWEERGPSEALKQGVGSLFGASLAYLVISMKEAEHLLFVFPELLLLLLAGTIVLGRYTGYRLTELYRFRTFLK